MHRLKFRLLLALLTFTCLSFAVAKTSADGKVKFPSDDPAFTVEFPPGWTFKTDKDGSLNCDPGDDSGFAFSILVLKDIHSEKELKAELPNLAKSMSSGASLENFKIGDVDITENGSGVRFIGVTGKGKADGATFVVLVNGFEPQKGKFFAIVTAGLEKADKKHHNDIEAISASIEPLRSQSKDQGKDAGFKPPGTEENAAVDQANTRLDAVYKRLIGKLDADGQKALKEAQRSWIKWREDGSNVDRARRWRGRWQQYAGGFCERAAQVNQPANGNPDRIREAVCWQLRQERGHA